MGLPIAEALRPPRRPECPGLGGFVLLRICGRRPRKCPVFSGLNGGEGGIPFHPYDTENTNLFALFVTQFVT
ncbi:hypothetical protein, partial [Mesorhizobium sp. M7A.F.Ca.CA.001.09.2.1]|uniref:hypothetical protein n=1 Tax=Mesorhizobium sp. M7A.F.Ca.CA.001.09.2.1 TaxID=2496719 RepID=UPI0019D260DE